MLFSKKVHTKRKKDRTGFYYVNGSRIMETNAKIICILFIVFLEL